MSIRPSQSPERTARVRVAALALIGSAALALPLLGTAAPNAALAPTAGPTWSDDVTELALPDSSRALVASDGAAVLLGTDGSITMRTVRGELAYGSSTSGVARMSKDELIAELTRPTLRPYAPSEVVVTFADGIEVPLGAAAVTGDAGTDEVLASIGMERVERLFTAADDASWQASRDAAEQATGAAVLDLRRTYRLSLSGVDPRAATAALLALPTVAWASPAWTVSAPQVTGVSVPLEVTSAAARVAAEVASSAASSAAKLPTNYGLRSNAQSHWNAPGLNAAAAYQHVTKELGELPGHGEIITTVGVGPLTSDPNGPCGGDVQFFGPTTTVIGDQRYIDMPSMPLIPTFTATAAADLDPLGEVCTNRDPLLADVGLALSVMSPLPHHQQRPEAIGSGLTDLLGLAPGAQHRLVVPASGLPTTIDLAGALLGASQQSPRPSVITASAHIGGEDVGFPNRYLEDDALLRSVITTIVHSDISVAVAAGDGTTTYRYSAFGPSGGGNRIDVAPPGAEPTGLHDLALSTAPSLIPDSGAIAVGATTLNDIFAVPPHGTSDLARRAQRRTRRCAGPARRSSRAGTATGLTSPRRRTASCRSGMRSGAGPGTSRCSWEPGQRSQRPRSRPRWQSYVRSPG